jgi:hypothetical protein
MLEILYKEYINLIGQHKVIVDKLNSIAGSIKHYGGDVPNADEVNMERVVEIQALVRETMYPENGTWGEKIIYILKRLAKPSTANEIFESMRHLEKVSFNAMNFQNTANTIAATCSRMAKDGQIGLDTSQKKNLYYII